MKNKCVSIEAKKFEDKLNVAGITLNQFNELRKMWYELSLDDQAEVIDLLAGTTLSSKIAKTDTEKLNTLIDYIRDAERYHRDMAIRGNAESEIKSEAVAEVASFMECELEVSF